MQKIQAVIFDWGGVLAEDPFPGLASYCAAALEVGEQEYCRAFNMFIDDFQIDRITEQQFWSKMTGKLKVAMPKAKSLWGDAIAAVYQSRQKVFSIAEGLKQARIKLAILSNTEKPCIEFLRRQLSDTFDTIVFSCLEGSAKPKSEIYELTLTRLGTQAGQTLFIDDRPENTEGAKRVGLHTILFEDVNQLKTALAGFDLNVV